MNKLNKKTPAVFYAALCVLCVTLISFSLTGGLFAKYATSAEGADSARVAKYDISVSEPTEGSLVLDSYDPERLSASTDITVTSNSEVAVEYGLRVVFPTALPQYVTVTLNGAEPTSIDALDKVFTFDALGTFAPGSYSETYTLTFSVDPAWQEADVILSGVSVVIYATQID